MAGIGRARSAMDMDLPRVEGLAARRAGHHGVEGLAAIGVLVEQRAAFLASPPLVVAFALAGRVDIDLEREPLGQGSDGRPVYLKDIWPTQEELAGVLSTVT